MNCEKCIHFEEHPFIRECDYDDYCSAYGNPFRKIDPSEIIFCPHFEE